MTLVWIPKPDEVRVRYMDRVCIRVISKDQSGRHIPRGTVSRVIGGNIKEQKHWYPLDEPWNEDKYPKFSLWLKKRYPLTYKNGRLVQDIIGYNKDKKKKKEKEEA